MQCPACEDSLAPHDYNGLATVRCVSCGGSWLSGQGFASLLEMDGSGFSPRDVAKLKVLTEYRVARNVQPTEHSCPRCAKKLKARNYAGIAGFFLEQCPGGCGVLVRDGDLDRIRILRSLGVVEEVKARPKPAAVPAATPEAIQKAVPPPPLAARAEPALRPTKRSPRAAPAPELSGGEATGAGEGKGGLLSRLLRSLFGRR